MDEISSEKNHEEIEMMVDEIDLIDQILSKNECIKLFVLIVVLNVRFLSNQMVNVLFTAAIVLLQMTRIEIDQEKLMKAN